MQQMLRGATAALIAVSLAACATTGPSSDPSADTAPRAPVPGSDRGGPMIADLLVVRPLGLVGTVVGAAGFLVSLPFTLPSNSAADAGRELVGKPFEYTFNRPLGEFERCGADRHNCGAP